MLDGIFNDIFSKLETIIIDNDYQLDESLEWHQQIKTYLLRYRRIIGIIMLIILIYLLNYCDNLYLNKPVPAPTKINNQKGGAAAVAQAAAGAVTSSATNAVKGAATNAVKGAATNAVKGTEGEQGDDNPKPKNIVEEYKNMKESGMTKMDIGKHLGKKAGRYMGEKTLEFANWLYEILFALAISIAICMVIVPSVSFFFLGLICYFLLRKKIIAIKSL
jgi:hypothetical protein